MLAIVEKKHLHLNNNNNMDFKNARKQFYASPRCETMTVELSGLLATIMLPPVSMTAFGKKSKMNDGKLKCLRNDEKYIFKVGFDSHFALVYGLHQ